MKKTFTEQEPNLSEAAFEEPAGTAGAAEEQPVGQLAGEAAEQTQNRSAQGMPAQTASGHTVSAAEGCPAAKDGAASAAAAEEERSADGAEEKKLSRRAQVLQVLKFTGFSISAGVIQLVSDGILCDWTGWLPWWPAYLISVLLSVLWNFTLNRKFTFRAANNVPVAMSLVALYYCAFIPLSTFGGDAIAARLPENLGLLVTFMMMVLNFVTEFFWDKFVVFNDKVTEKIVRLFTKKRGKNAAARAAEPQADPASLPPADLAGEELAEAALTDAADAAPADASYGAPFRTADSAPSAESNAETAER